ncbi:hypothetical protein [Bacillus sp. AFS053548]|uniref:hypothetical protein n=1 Tax=Bacillus sp. AFS053548 TaxID=2033505 RepID=UPI000BFBAA41|nr:hypothetical protein [Bacillus sp. AFS053548]PGM57353.1 hypothetical protein CN946_07280 [Bacillus sp. AFS053548]
MKRISLFKLSFIILPLLLVACRFTPSESQSIIDWVDFVRVNGVEYNGIQSGILANEEFIDEKVGEVKFRVADHVTNPNYKIKDGDAAFHEKGTAIYSIKGNPELIALKEKTAINGYRIYFAKGTTDYKWYFKDVPIEKVDLIEIYQSFSPGAKKISEIKDKEKIVNFLAILKNSKEDSNFQPNNDHTDSTRYEIVLYTNEPIAYKYTIEFDGANYYWYPWDTSILSNEIGEFIPK